MIGTESTLELELNRFTGRLPEGLASLEQLFQLYLYANDLTGPLPHDLGPPYAEPSLIGKPQMWERAQVGFGGTGRKRKGPCTKQCAWRKHSPCDTRLAEACAPEL